MKYGDLGSLVPANAGSASVIEALVDELMTLRDANAAYEAMDSLEQAVEDFIVDILEPELNEYAPPYCSFGKQNEQYGFWVDEDAIRMAVHDGDLLSVDDLSEVPEDYVGDVLVFNDHGNMSLGYIDESTKEFVETWSCV